MIRFEKTDTWGFEHAIRGMRNPLNSWDKSDSQFSVMGDNLYIGDKDRDLMTKLIKGGSPHRKFLRQIFVSVDITAPLYWWTEFDTYKVGTTANSCSKMHTLHKRDLKPEDFSCEHLSKEDEEIFETLVDYLNFRRRMYISTRNKQYWWSMIQFLPESFNQKRTVTMTYENLLNILEYRRGHKLDEWRDFCDWIRGLPYAYLLEDGIKHE